jgi:hypothetical protein
MIHDRVQILYYSVLETCRHNNIVYFPYLCDLNIFIYLCVHLRAGDDIPILYDNRLF